MRGESGLGQNLYEEVAQNDNALNLLSRPNVRLTGGRERHRNETLEVETYSHAAPGTLARR